MKPIQYYLKTILNLLQKLFLVFRIEFTNWELIFTLSFLISKLPFFIVLKVYVFFSKRKKKKCGYKKKVKINSYISGINKDKNIVVGIGIYMLPKVEGI